MPITKRNVQRLQHTLLKHEIVKHQFGAFLLRDNREYEFYCLEESEGYLTPRNNLLPAEGIIFLTNYRIFFHGTSIYYDEKLGIGSQLKRCSLSYSYKLLTKRVFDIHFFINLFYLWGPDFLEKFNFFGGIKTFEERGAYSVYNIAPTCMYNDKMLKNTPSCQVRYNEFWKALKIASLASNVYKGWYTPAYTCNHKKPYVQFQQVQLQKLKVSQCPHLPKFLPLKCRHIEFKYVPEQPSSFHLHSVVKVLIFKRLFLSVFKKC